MPDPGFPAPLLREPDCACAVRVCVCTFAGWLVPKKVLDLLSIFEGTDLGTRGENSPDPGKSACYLIPLPGSECPRCPGRSAAASAVRALPR